MPNRAGPTRRPVTAFVERLARVAFTFVVMNCAAVAGLGAALLGRKVWRES